MYEELAKNLRDYAAVRKGEIAELTNEAADAIEKLQGTLFLMKKTAEFVAEKVPQWIPVTERLPMDVGYYIVYCWDGHINRVSFAKWQKNNRRWDLSATRAYWKVSHWMPLPEPPKEERK